MQKLNKLESAEFQQCTDGLCPQPALLQWLELMPDEEAESQAQAVIVAAAKAHAQARVVQQIAEVAAAALRDGEEALFFRAVELCGPQILAHPAVRDELVGRWVAVAQPSSQEREKGQAFFRDLGRQLSVGATADVPPRMLAEEKGGRRSQLLTLQMRKRPYGQKTKSGNQMSLSAYPNARPQLRPCAQIFGLLYCKAGKKKRRNIFATTIQIL